MGGRWHFLNTSTHPHPLWAGMQMCPLDFIPIHAWQGSIFRSGWKQWGPHRLWGYLSQLGLCCSFSDDNSTELYLGS